MHKTMNQLTTIAALPSGGGCKASLPAEKAEPVSAKPMRPSLFKEGATIKLDDLLASRPGGIIRVQNFGEVQNNPYLGLIASAKLGQLGYCVKDGVIERLPEEKSWGAFEPFSYAERN